MDVNSPSSSSSGERSAQAPADSIRRRPQWLKLARTDGPNYRELKGLMRGMALHTVCEEARCPNVGECWEQRTATFMILGSVCTRACRFCAVDRGHPPGLDADEPKRVAATARALGLRYVVVTSVTRDDLPDGGSSVFVATVADLRAAVPGCQVEVLIPDFHGSPEALRAVLEARPDVLNHNVETVPRLYKTVRPGASYRRSLDILRSASQFDECRPTKSGIMVGFGESWDEVLQTVGEIRETGCQMLTIGQYLRPSLKHHPVIRYYTPGEFRSLKQEGERLGFRHVESGPLVRSSYHARQQATGGR